MSRQASAQEIKQAYRRKARETHPDKRTANVPAEEAAEAFRKVVHAFEVLSDDASRRMYDRTGRDPGSPQPGGNQQQQQQHYGNFHSFTWSFRRTPIRLKDKFEVQEAQSRVLHIVSLEQLKTVMLDDHDMLDKHLLMCFVTPEQVEQLADDEMVFPYPFAAMSSQGIWWEDLLQTVKIRYHRSNELTKFFDVPSGDELRQSGKPLFLFGRRGDPLSSNFTRLQTSNRNEFEQWVWKMVEVQVEFVNRHNYPVELYWVHGSRAHIKETLPAHHTMVHTSMLTHEWYARDARVDTHPGSPGRWKLSTESSLGSWKIGIEGGPAFLDDGTVRIEIPSKACFDLSGHCSFWQSHGECRKNPVFMREQCSLTCQFCNPKNQSSESEDGPDRDEL